jgi:hypothetical protein
MNVFERERAAFERMKPTLLAYAPGQFVVIEGDTCYAVARTYEEALRAGDERLGPVPFMVKQVLEYETPILITRILTGEAR